jgi:hypothetical protein
LVEIVCLHYTHDEGTKRIREQWLDSHYIRDLYFASATYSTEFSSYLSEDANHYLVAVYTNRDALVSDIYRHVPSRLALFFSSKMDILDRAKISRLNFISANVLKRGYGRLEIDDLGYVFSRKQWRIKSASIASMAVIPQRALRFSYPYSDNILLLQLDSEESHISEQRYCEKVRMDIIRRGIYVDHLLSLSILEQMR